MVQRVSCGLVCADRRVSASRSFRPRTWFSAERCWAAMPSWTNDSRRSTSVDQGTRRPAESRPSRCGLEQSGNWTRAVRTPGRSSAAAGWHSPYGDGPADNPIVRSTERPLWTVGQDAGGNRGPDLAPVFAPGGGRPTRRRDLPPIPPNLFLPRPVCHRCTSRRGCYDDRLNPGSDPRSE